MQIYNDGAQGTPTGSSGGGGGGVSLDDTDALSGAGDKVQGLSTFSDTARTRLEGATGAAAAFGTYPAGQSFAEHHDAVAEVMSSTMGGMSADIQTFGGNIVASAKNYRDTDETAAGAVQALGASLSAPSKVDDAFRDARENQADRLTDVRMDAGDAEKAGTLDGTVDMLSDVQPSNGAADDTNTVLHGPTRTGPTTS